MLFVWNFSWIVLAWIFLLWMYTLILLKWVWKYLCIIPRILGGETSNVLIENHIYVIIFLKFFIRELFSLKNANWGERLKCPNIHIKELFFWFQNSKTWPVIEYLLLWLSLKGGMVEEFSIPWPFLLNIKSPWSSRSHYRSSHVRS